MYQFIPWRDLSEFPSYFTSFPENIKGGGELGEKGVLKKWKMIKNIFKNLYHVHQFLSWPAEVNKNMASLFSIYFTLLQAWTSTEYHLKIITPRIIKS